MAAESEYHGLYRSVTVLAQDPDVNLFTKVDVPNEYLEPGPRGRRFEIIDYDADQRRFYGAHNLSDIDKYERVKDVSQVLDDPVFHAQNTFGVAASTLVLFEKALGRHLGWGFASGSHQLKIFPHAFLEANAFYSKNDECLAFGYFPRKGSTSDLVYTCLSHDIITHETTHAIIDGLRPHFVRPASLDQLAFHEGFSDIIALLKVLSDQEMIHKALSLGAVETRITSQSIIIREAINKIKSQTFLNGLAQQMAKGMNPMGRDALRRSIELQPDTSHYHNKNRFYSPHDRGEILVAAVMLAHQHVWLERIRKSEDDHNRPIATWRIEEEGAKSAKHLLQILIRAIDYMPPVNISFRDFLSAVITADRELVPDDGSYQYRKQLLKSFAMYGIKPVGFGSKSKGYWEPGFDASLLTKIRGNLSTLRSDGEEIFRFIWRNHKALNLTRGIYTKVESVRPVWRIGPDGFVLRETVAQYYQLNKNAKKADLEKIGVPVPKFMKENPDVAVELLGGGTLIFDEFGQLKFHIYNPIKSKGQHNRLNALWARGAFMKNPKAEEFSGLHRNRSLGQNSDPKGSWGG